MDCVQRDCQHYNSLEYCHDNPEIAKTQIPPPTCEECCRFYSDNYRDEERQSKAKGGLDELEMFIGNTHLDRSIQA